MRVLFLSLIVFLVVSTNVSGYAQVIPMNRYETNRLLLDKLGDVTSFAFSLRKLTNRYSGYALRLRRSTDNVEADVSFDASNNVSATSIVHIASPQSSGLFVGDIMPLAVFIQSATVYASIWYDQGGNHYDATQNDVTKQPVFTLGSSGLTDSQYAALGFVGTSKQALVVNQGMEIILGGGVRGTLLLIAKLTAQSQSDSFGYLSSVGDPSFGQRWSCHLNWSDGNCYFDASETCCVQYRAFPNSSNLNLFKQYAFVRGDNHKTVRVNGAATPLANTAVPSSQLSGGAFGVGTSSGSVNNGFTGKVTELIFFPADLPLNRLKLFESDQLPFWSL